METTFIYALCEPGTRTIRYIGKSDDPTRRFNAHLSQSRKGKNYLGNWLRSLVEKPSIVVLREVPVEQWKIAEERYIRLARGLGMKLVNATDGGDGGGWIHPPEVRKKISLSKTGKPASKASVAASHTPEANAKRSASNTGKTRTPECRAKMSADRKGKKQTPEECANKSARMTGKKRNPEIGLKISATRKGKPATEAMLAAQRNPEAIAKRSARMTGEGNHFFGREHTDETKALIRAKLLERRLAKGAK